MPSLANSPIAATCHASGNDRAKVLRASIDAHVESLANALDDVRASDFFKAFLAVQARFHRYSWHNAMLILTQKPDASRVAGFTTWKGLGRFVRKGEHGIAIFAPCPFTREVAGDDGSPEVRSGIFFKAVHVFDVSQTDGQPLPELEVPSIDVAADSLLASLERVAGRRGITLVREDMPENMNGASKNGSIALRNGMVSGQEAKTLAHELAHEALHWTKGERIDRNTAELEAESVAYVVCCHFGLDVEVRASRYIALWGGDSKGLRESLERIASTARAMIDDVDALPADQALTVNVAERVSTVNVAERAVA